MTLKTTRWNSPQMLDRQSFIELKARSRALALLDEGTFREILGPFERLESPWLEPQGIVPQSDDGVIVARVASTESLPLSWLSKAHSREGA